MSVTDEIPEDMSWPLVVMGVSGVGKTTVARLIAEALGARFVDADDLHSPASIRKMSAGVALTDDDRWPWLERVGDALNDRHRTVVACSALRRAYRSVLSDRAPGVSFIHLTAPVTRINEMSSARVGHFMPVTLLDSQLQTLEPLGSDERGTVIHVDDSPKELAARALARIRTLHGSVAPGQ